MLPGLLTSVPCGHQNYLFPSHGPPGHFLARLISPCQSPKTSREAPVPSDPHPRPERPSSVSPTSFIPAPCGYHQDPHFLLVVGPSPTPYSVHVIPSPWQTPMHTSRFQPSFQGALPFPPLPERFQEGPPCRSSDASLLITQGWSGFLSQCPLSLIQPPILPEHPALAWWPKASVRVPEFMNQAEFCPPLPSQGLGSHLPQPRSV